MLSLSNPTSLADVLVAAARDASTRMPRWWGWTVYLAAGLAVRRPWKTSHGAGAAGPCARDGTG